MKTAFNIARVELQVLFYSPIARLFLSCLLQVGMFFCPTFGDLHQSGYREPIAGRTFISDSCILAGISRDHAVFILYPADYDGVNESRAEVGH